MRLRFAPRRDDYGPYHGAKIRTARARPLVLHSAPDNPHIVGLPEFNSQNLPGPQLRYQVAEDGTYKIVGLPGRGYVCLWTVDDRPCPAGQGLDQIPDLPKAEEFRPITHVFEPAGSIFTMVKEVRPGEQDTQAALGFRSFDGRNRDAEHCRRRRAAGSLAKCGGCGRGNSSTSRKMRPQLSTSWVYGPTRSAASWSITKSRNIGCELTVCRQDLNGVRRRQSFSHAAA